MLKNSSEQNLLVPNLVNIEIFEIIIAFLRVYIMNNPLDMYTDWNFSTRSKLNNNN